MFFDSEASLQERAESGLNAARQFSLSFCSVFYFFHTVRNSHLASHPRKFIKSSSDLKALVWRRKSIDSVDSRFSGLLTNTITVMLILAAGIVLSVAPRVLGRKIRIPNAIMRRDSYVGKSPAYREGAEGWRARS